MKRKSGILLPVASLPSPCGIGCFSKEAYEFVDFLAAAGQSYWQILPLGQTGYGDSPYQSFSTFAGNPYFIDPVSLCDKGWLKQSELKKYDFGDDPQYVDYEKIWKSRFKMLHAAYRRSPYTLSAPDSKDRQAFEAFIEEKKDWLPDYALFSALKDRQKGKSFLEWPKPLRTRQDKALKKAKEELAEEIRFVEFQQYLFFAQWHALRSYAAERGIKIIGDIPIYVALDSADTWASGDLFQLDEDGQPTQVAGCPPDAFSATGQLWGNPLYRWEYHKKTGYTWWMNRLRNCFDLYDIVRIDHFRGFDEYYAIPYGDATAEFGHWEKGPGFDFIGLVKRAFGKDKVIAEDLGFLTPSVLSLVKKSGFPGMKVLQFAFDSREESDYLPHNYPRNCVVYTGTHDNETMAGWCRTVKRADYRFAKKYLGFSGGKDPQVHFIRAALSSVADTAIIPIQDYLGLGSEARINTPSTLGGLNWKWRLLPDQLTDDLAASIREMTRLYGRL